VALDLHPPFECDHSEIAFSPCTVFDDLREEEDDEGDEDDEDDEEVVERSWDVVEIVQPDVAGIAAAVAVVSRDTLVLSVLGVDRRTFGCSASNQRLQDRQTFSSSRSPVVAPIPI